MPALSLTLLIQSQQGVWVFFKKAVGMVKGGGASRVEAWEILGLKVKCAL